MLPMSAAALQKANKTGKKRLFVQICATFCAVSIAVLVTTSRSSNEVANNEGAKSTGILKGTTSSGTSYYSCGQKSAPSIVLLHGARYTKEDWQTSGILEKFCGNGVSVAALDLNVRATSAELLMTVSELSDLGAVSTPIAAIVTPSASGFTMMDGILNGNVDALRKEILRWIPVATNSANQYGEKDLVGAKAWPMLAVYGDQDISGKQSSNLWKTVAGAKVVELKVCARMRIPPNLLTPGQLVNREATQSILTHQTSSLV